MSWFGCLLHHLSSCPALGSFSLSSLPTTCLQRPVFSSTHLLLCRCRDAWFSSSVHAKDLEGVLISHSCRGRLVRCLSLLQNQPDSGHLLRGNRRTCKWFCSRWHLGSSKRIYETVRAGVFAYFEGNPFDDTRCEHASICFLSYM
jgi:hypothetical protein